MENTINTQVCTNCHKNGCSCGLDIAMLLLRLGLAAVFLYHGAGKVMNLTGTVTFFDSLGVPAFLTYLVTAGEIGIGLSMLFGVFTKYFGYLTVVIMLGAIYLVHWKNGFNFMVGGYEYNLFLILSALAVSFAGPGKYSVMKSHCGDMCMKDCENSHK